jgi:hypothetical protein
VTFLQLGEQLKQDWIQCPQEYLLLKLLKRNLRKLMMLGLKNSRRRMEKIPGLKTGT